MNAMNERISAIGVVPVIKLNHPERDAAKLGKALSAGGVPVAEITFRAAGADTAIKLMKEACPDMLVGAGTVTTTAQIDKVIAAGGDFIVSPGFDPELVAYQTRDPRRSSFPARLSDRTKDGACIWRRDRIREKTQRGRELHFRAGTGRCLAEPAEIRGFQNRAQEWKRFETVTWLIRGREKPAHYHLSRAIMGWFSSPYKLT